MDTRNSLLDFTKTIAAIGVIFVHFHLMNGLGAALGAVGVTGVIIFFFISGYQSYSNDGSSCEKIKRRFKRNLKLTVIAIAVYLVYTVIEQALLGTLTDWLSNYTQPVVWVRMIIMGDFDLINADHLWYMSAMLFVYPILYIMEKKRLHKVFYVFIPLLLLLRAGMETFTNSFSTLDWHFSGNFLCGALPIMLFGNYIASHKERILKPKPCVFVVGSAVSMALVFVFTYVKVGGLDISQFFKITAGFFILVTCLKLPEVNISRFLGTIGRKYSLYIYLYHMLIGKILALLFEALALPFFMTGYVLPFIVIVLSVLVSYVIVLVLSKTGHKEKATV